MFAIGITDDGRFGIVNVLTGVILPDGGTGEPILFDTREAAEAYADDLLDSLSTLVQGLLTREK